MGGTKRVIDDKTHIVAGDMSGNIESDSTNILHCDRVGFQLAWTGTPTGDFGIDVSNDDTTWVALTLSDPVTAAGSADEAFIDVETAAKFVRLNYSFGSGTGTLTGKLTAKSISG